MRNEAEQRVSGLTYIFMSLSCILAGFSTFLPSMSANLSRTLLAAREDEERICSMRLRLLARLRLPSGDGERSSVFVTWIVGMSVVLVVLPAAELFRLFFGSPVMMLSSDLMSGSPLSTNCLAGYLFGSCRQIWNGIDWHVLGYGLARFVALVFLV